MHSDTVDIATEKLLTILPLVFRGIRKKVRKKAITDFDIDISPLHFEIMKLLEVVVTSGITEIGEKLQIAGPQMTHLIDKLVDLGMVERQAGKADRRVINIALTSKGKTTLEEQDSCIRNAFKETLSCLTDEELKDISTSLCKLRDIFSKSL